MASFRGLYSSHRLWRWLLTEVVMTEKAAELYEKAKELARLAMDLTAEVQTALLEAQPIAVEPVKEYMSVAEAAEALSMSEGGIRVLMRDKRLSFSQIGDGGRVIITRADLDAMLKKFRVPTAQEVEHDAMTIFNNTRRRLYEKAAARKAKAANL